LRDPNLEVRLEAAHALGEIADPGAVESLIQALRDPAAGILEEAARALGRIGDRRAVSELAQALRDSERLMRNRERIAVAQALGDIGGTDAARILLEEFDETEDAEVQEAVARALGEIGETYVVPRLLQALDSNPPRSLEIALIRALGELGDPAALNSLRLRLVRTPADPILLPNLADALARLHDAASIPALVAHLSALDSVVARKQVAVAIGQLIGEKETLYGLLSQESFARDEAASRLLNEAQRRLKSLPGAPECSLTNRYVSSDYAGLMEDIRAILDALPTEESPAAQCLMALRNAPEMGAELAILAAAALRSRLHEE
jgi:HEAT repeat protein